MINVSNSSRKKFAQIYISSNYFGALVVTDENIHKEEDNHTNAFLVLTFFCT